MQFIHPHLKVNAMRISVGWRASILVLSAMAVGCDSAGDAAGQDGTPAGTSVRKPAKDPEAIRLAANMVSAVSAGDGAGPVDVKFELMQRPEVGKPVDISLALVPTASLERLYAQFQAGDGLEIVKGGEMGQLVRPAAGAAIAHLLTVIPRRDGIFTILAVVLTDTATESVSRNFSIPVIASYVESPENPAPH